MDENTKRVQRKMRELKNNSKQSQKRILIRQIERQQRKSAIIAVLLIHTKIQRRILFVITVE